MDQEQAIRVLVVEDELIVAEDLSNSLRELGFEVVGSVGVAKEAIAAASAQRPDLVLMDIQLQGEPAGIPTADTIRRQWNIPIIFLTAYTSGELLDQARATGAHGFLSKPFRLDDLNAAIRIALQQHKLSKELFAEHNWLVTILASLSDGVIAADASGSVRYINPAAAALTGWSAADALGKAIEEIYPLKYMDHSAVTECQLRRALNLRSPIPKERFLMKLRGNRFLPVEDAAAPIIEEGHLLGAATIFQDISSRVDAEEQQQLEHGRLQQEMQTTSAALGQTREELQTLSGRLITAQEDERRRVARELHDDLGQRAALMGWRISELSQLAVSMPSEARREITKLQEDLSHLSASIRDVSHRLHPAVVADLGLAMALEGLVEQQRALGVDITFISREVPDTIPDDVATALYRIAQEAVRNAIQHAPEAPILVSLIEAMGELQMSIEDPGPGFDVKSALHNGGGLGLLSIQERARLAGGHLAIDTATHHGTRITVKIPSQPLA